MTKQELLDKIEQDELERINNLSCSAFRKEAQEWFVDSDEGDTMTCDISTLKIDYMEDYMRWQNDKSIEELQELIS
jgi:hypothetical protein